MIRSIGLAVADLTNGRVLAIMLRATGISVLIFCLLGALLGYLLTDADPCAMLDLSSCRIGMASGAVGAIALTLLAAWFLFPAIAITVITAFTNQLAAAVEEQHYPSAAKSARPVAIGRSMAMGLKSASRLFFFNLLALPFYLLLLVTGVGPFILFVIVNGIAFGRDLGDIAAARHGDHRSRQTWLRDTRGQQHLIGLVVSILFLVPFANLVAPVIGTAAAIHLFNRSFWTMQPKDREWR